ncbi:MAG: arginase family protein [bacterium]
MNYFEKEPIFLRDYRNTKLKDIAIIKQDYEIDSNENQSIFVPICWDGSTAGRPGSRLCPQKIIQKLLNLNYNQNYTTAPVIMPYVKVINGDRFTTFQNISLAVSKVINKGKVFFIGGDHSITFPIVQTYLNTYKRINLLVFDSHFDLRHLEEGHSSGTYLNEICKNFYDKVKPVIIGINNAYNPGYLYEVANEYDVKYLSCEDVIYGSFDNVYRFITQNLEVGLPVYVSIDVDCIDSSYIDSVNSLNCWGLSLREVYRIYEYVKRNFEIVGTDLVESNCLVGDVDRSVSVLAEFLYRLSGYG